MFAEAIKEGVSRGVAAGVVLGLAKLDILSGDAERFLQRDSFEAITPDELGIRDALIELGYLERRWWQIRYQRTDKPLPDGKAFRKMLDHKVDQILAERGRTRASLPPSARSTLARLAA